MAGLRGLLGAAVAAGRHAAGVSRDDKGRTGRVAGRAGLRCGRRSGSGRGGGSDSRQRQGAGRRAGRQIGRRRHLGADLTAHPADSGGMAAELGCIGGGVAWIGDADGAQGDGSRVADAVPGAGSACEPGVAACLAGGSRESRTYERNWRRSIECQRPRQVYRASERLGCASRKWNRTRRPRILERGPAPVGGPRLPRSWSPCSDRTVRSPRVPCVGWDGGTGVAMIVRGRKCPQMWNWPSGPRTLSTLARPSAPFDRTAKFLDRRDMRPAPGP